VLGGRLADWLHDWEWHFMGQTYINYHVLFFLALLVRGVNAIWVAPRLHEPEATSTRETVHEMIPHLIENISARITRPFGSRGD
jgi:hypothetical protein